MAQQNKYLVEQSIEDGRKAKEKSAVDKKHCATEKNKLISTKCRLEQALSANRKVKFGV
jgi:hypothetical protein